MKLGIFTKFGTINQTVSLIFLFERNIFILCPQLAPIALDVFET